VAKHLAVLPDQTSQALYRAATLRLLPLAEQKHPETSYAPLEHLLKEGSRI
jgi:hypothetical protein